MSTADREISAERLLDAPRELVFDVWTNPKHVAEWWGPNGFKNTVHEMNVTPGGIWRLTMHGPDGTDYPNEIHYIEVKRPELLIYSHGGAENHPDSFRVTVKFTAIGNKTKLTMQMLFKSAQERNDVAEKYGAVEGLRQTLDRLEAFVLERHLATEAQRIS